MTVSLYKRFWGCCLFGLSTLVLPAAEPVSAWLSRSIIGPAQTEAEVQAFAERRVVAMPEVKSAQEWRRTAERLRRETLERVVFRGEAVRWQNAKARVEWLDTIEGGPGYRIRKLRYEALPGLWIPALLYEPEQLSGKVPVVLNLNGHEAAGKAVLNKQLRCINLAKRGMLALSPDWLGMGQLNGANYKHALMNQLDLCGASGLAPFYLAMQRGLDVLLSLDHADRKRVAVTGLSGGGWQTVFLSALDPRVTLANPVAGYSSFRTRLRYGSDLGDSEQHPCDMATTAASGRSLAPASSRFTSFPAAARRSAKTLPTQLRSAIRILIASALSLGADLLRAGGMGGASHAAAKRLVERDPVEELRELDADERLLGGEQRSLGDQHGEVAVDPGAVAGGGQKQRLLERVDQRRLSVPLLDQRRTERERVAHL